VSGERNKVGLGTCVALAMANMIGTGVFASLGFQVEVLPSPFLIVVLWILGGLVSLCGALSYAELAAALPRSGGEYNFLAQVYHPAIGFMGGFVSVMVGFAAPIAATAMISGAYLAAAVPGLPAFGASFVVALGLAGMHALTVRASGRFQVVVTALKVGLILAFLVLGLCKGRWPEQGFGPHPGDWRAMLSAPFAISLMYVLYSYTGWNAAAYIMNEVRRPEWTVPRALLIATVLVTFLYVGLNAVFLASGPMADFVGKPEVGEIAARHLIGEAGGRIMAGLIGFGLVSAISAMTWAGPRVAQTIGQDFAALGFLAKTSTGGVPRRALALQTVIVGLLLATGTFKAIIAYAFVAILTCSFLAVLGVIVLRVRRPDLSRPFRCWGYPVTPLVFLLLNGFTLVHTCLENPMEAWAGVVTLAAGIGLYFVAKMRKVES
jgi:APA family basic amino acid/polyamine antiporter